MRTISIIAPVYNHEDILGEHSCRILAEADKLRGYDCELLLINDGSKDHSRDEMDKLTDPRIRCLHQENGGFGSVLQLGLQRANGELLLILDLDLSYDIGKLADLVQLSEEYDCIIASKHMTQNAYPLHRKYLSLAHARFAQRLFGIPVRDFGSGLVLVKSKFFQKAVFSSRGFGVHIEFYLQLYLQKARILEIPCMYKHRPGSFRLFFHGAQTMKEICAISWKHFTLGHRHHHATDDS